MDTQFQDVLAGFERWLRSERGLAESSVQTELWHATVFMRWLPEPLDASLATLDAGIVVRFVAFNADHGYSRNYLKARHRALRTFLRFLHIQGVTGRLYSGAVPPVAVWQLSGVPRGLEQAQVDALLSSFDVSSAAGLRDRAMVLTMVRLGLRCIEVARLRLNHVDWHAGTLSIRGKAGQMEQLPLLDEVGQALSDYLSTGVHGATAAKFS